jgi:hypothetical protein
METRMKFKILSIVILSSTALSAFAAPPFEIQECSKAGIGIDTIVTPVGKNSRSFYNGAVQVYNIDVEEPAARSAGLAIVMPFAEGDGPGASCTAITFFSSVDIMKVKSSYNAEKGLLLTVPFGVYDPETGTTVPSRLPVKIRVNLAKTSVDLE